jgi:hypothetical protein
MYHKSEQSYKSMNLILKIGKSELWLGNFNAAINIRLLDLHDIKFILTIAEELTIHPGNTDI